MQPAQTHQSAFQVPSRLTPSQPAHPQVPSGLTHSQTAHPHATPTVQNQLLIQSTQDATQHGSGIEESRKLKKPGKTV